METLKAGQVLKKPVRKKYPAGNTSEYSQPGKIKKLLDFKRALNARQQAVDQD